MTNDIEGTIETKGLSDSISRRAVGSYEGAAIHLNTGSGVPNVRRGLGQINIAVLGDFDAPNLQARELTANTNTTAIARGPLISPEAVADGMQALHRATEQYTDTINTVKAKKEELVLRENLLSLFNGDDKNPGYLSKKGIAAIDGYKDFSVQLEDTMRSSLQNLPPAARQKAVMDFFDIKESYLSKAASHSTSEKAKLDTGLRQAERETIRKEIHAYPPDALGSMQKGPDGKESYTASKLKQRFFSTFEVDELDQANSAWEHELLTAAEKVYLNGRGKVDEKGVYKIGEGLEDAKVFRDVIGRQELPADALVKLDKAIFAWENNEISNFTQNYDHRERQEQKMLTRVQNTNAALLHMDLYQGKKQLSGYDVWQKVARQEISESDARSYMEANRRMIAGEDEKTDPSKYFEISSRIIDTESSNFIADDGSSVIQLINNSPGLKRQDRINLLNDAISLRKEGNSDRLKDAKNMISAIIPGGKDIMGNSLTDQGRALEYMANQSYRRLFNEYSSSMGPAEAHAKAKESVNKEYSTVKVRVSALQPLYDGVRPESKTDLRNLLAKIQADRASGKMSKAEYDEKSFLARTYMTMLRDTEDINIRD